MRQRPLPTSATFAALVTVVALAGCAANPARVETAAGDRFAPCPTAPRCATTQPGGGGDVIAPLVGGADSASAREALLALLAEDPHYEVLRDDGDYVHAEYTTELMNYRDDVEFLIRPDGTIDARSAARLGWYDWETNRRRLERLRSALDALRRDAEPR